MDKLESYVVSAVFDTDSWILFDKDGEPVEWPDSWPKIIDPKFLEDNGVEIGA